MELATLEWWTNDGAHYLNIGAWNPNDKDRMESTYTVLIVELSLISRQNSY